MAKELTLSEACKLVGELTGGVPHYDTLYRWCTQGMTTPDGPVRLASRVVSLGGRTVRVVRASDVKAYVKAHLHGRPGPKIGSGNKGG
jgi:hypothetical protein